METRKIIVLFALCLCAIGANSQNTSANRGQKNELPAICNSPGYVSPYYINPGINISADYINGNLPDIPGYNPNYPYIPVKVPFSITTKSYNTCPVELHDHPLNNTQKVKKAIIVDSLWQTKPSSGKTSKK